MRPLAMTGLLTTARSGQGGGALTTLTNVKQEQTGVEFTANKAAWI